MEADAVQKKLLAEYHQALEDGDAHPVESRAGNATPYKTYEQEFRDRGLRFFHGRWTKLEVKKLHENFKDWVMTYQDVIGNPVDFLTIGRTENQFRRKEVTRLKSSTNMFTHLMRGIYRPLQDNYSIVLWRLDPRNVSKNNKYTQEEIDRMLEMLDEEKLTLDQIGNALGRSWYSIDTRLRNLQPSIKHLTKKQERKLIKEIQRRFPESDLVQDFLVNVPWRQICNDIGLPNSSDKSLQSYWDRRIKILCSDGKIRLKHMERTKIETKLVMECIDMLYEESAPTIYMADWLKVYKKVCHRFGSGYYLQRFFRNLFRRYHIDHDVLGFPETIKQLRTIYQRVSQRHFEELNLDEPFQQYNWMEHHWALDPLLAHYIHESNYMHKGYQETEPVIKVEVSRCDEDEGVW